MPKYIDLAKPIIDKIEKGQIAENVKMISLRSFCKLHHISMTTALTCYRYLEKNGYLRAENKKGYYTSNPFPAPSKNQFPLFESRIFTNHSSRLEQRIIPAVNSSLATAQLDIGLIDTMRLNRCLKSVTRQIGFNLLYDDFNGNGQLREQLSKHFNLQGFSFSSSELVITHGCLDAVLIALETVSQFGDVIAVSSPCYSGLLDILVTLGRAIFEIPSTENGLDLNQLESALKNGKIKACLLTANYQNPTGHSLSNQQKQEIAGLGEKYQVPIIEDDVFRELSHQSTTPLPIKYFDKQGWVMWCSSVSKTLAPGLRIGWCAPGRFTARFIRQRTVRTLGLNQPLQLALAEYIGKGYYRSHLTKVNQTLRSNCDKYIDFLLQNLPSQAETYRPSGGLVLWIRLPNLDTQILSLKLAKRMVHIKAGNLFSTTDLYHDCLRLNIGNIPNERIYIQLDLLCSLITDAYKKFD